MPAHDSPFGRAYILFALTLVGAVNWADRLVVPILFPGIRKDLGLSDTQLGVISGLAFSLIYAVSSFGFGYAADRYLRKRVIAVGLVIWSAATAASGLAESFWGLCAARFVTGIGEASLYPCSLSLIAETFPSERRGRALGIFAAAAAIGGGLGVGLGGSLSQTLGWQKVFFVYGAAGLLCLPVLLMIPEPRRATNLAHAEPTAKVIRELLLDRRLAWLWACATVAMGSGQGFGAWAPSYFVRTLGLDVKEAGALFGIAALSGGIFGGILGGTLSDRLRKTRPGSELVVPACAAFAAGVLALVTIEAGRGALSYAGGLLTTLAIYAIFPGLMASMLSFVGQHRHGAAGALNTLFMGGIGAATGPFVIGVASDSLGDLHAALFIPVVGLLLAGALALRAAHAARAASENASDSAARHSAAGR